jgi:hypothetical protein
MDIEVKQEKKISFLYHLNTSLIYPAILGSIVYSFLDNIAHFVLENDKTEYLTCLKINNFLGFLIFSALSLILIWHFCIDFLYSMYSEKHYRRLHFTCDIVIVAFLGFFYINMSNSVLKNDLGYFRVALFLFWISMIVVYLIFLAWDYSNERKSENKNHKSFYRSMYRQFEPIAMIVYCILAILTILMINEGFFSVLALSVQILSFFLITRKFQKKMLELKKLP